MADVAQVEPVGPRVSRGDERGADRVVVAAAHLVRRDELVDLDKLLAGRDHRDLRGVGHGLRAKEELQQQFVGAQIPAEILIGYVQAMVEKERVLVQKFTQVADAVSAQQQYPDTPYWLMTARFGQLELEAHLRWGYSDYFEAHYNLGRIYLDEKGYTEAAAELQAAVNLRPDDAKAHNNLGLALKHNSDLNGAIAQYQRAVRIDPKMASAQNNLANVLYAKRDFNGAIQHYRAALAIQPNSAETHMNLGSALDDAGKPDEAIAEYKEAIKLEPKNASAHYNLAIVYVKKKDYATAIAELRQAAKLSPDWPTPHIMLTNLQKDSDPKAALDECVIADGLTNDAKLHNLCSDLQRKVQQGGQ